MTLERIGRFSRVSSGRRLVKLGIQAFDEHIRGFPINSTILLIGDPGSGFIEFLHQILIARTDAGAKISYVSLDLPKSEIMYDLSVYNWNNVPWDTMAESWNFTDLSPSSTQSSDRKGILWESDAVNLLTHNLIRQINEKKEQMKSDLSGGPISLDSVVNSLSSILLKSDLRTVLGFINELSVAIRETGGLHFLVLVKGIHGIEVEKALAHYVDCVLEFTLKQTAGKFERIMGVMKMRGVPMPPTQTYPIEFTSTGVRPEPTERLRGR